MGTFLAKLLSFSFWGVRFPPVALGAVRVPVNVLAPLRVRGPAPFLATGRGVVVRARVTVELPGPSKLTLNVLPPMEARVKSVVPPFGGFVTLNVAPPGDERV